MRANKQTDSLTIKAPDTPKPPPMSVEEYAAWVESEWLAWGEKRRLKAAEATLRHRVNVPFKA